MKVVYHINEIDKFMVVTGNIRNTLAYDNTIEVVIVANGPAVTLFTNHNLELVPGASYHLCNNSLNSHHLTVKDLIEGVVIVPSGVIDIIHLQNQNYRYIKP